MHVIVQGIGTSLAILPHPLYQSHKSTEAKFLKQCSLLGCEYGFTSPNRLRLSKDTDDSLNPARFFIHHRIVVLNVSRLNTNNTRQQGDVVQLLF